MIVTYLSVYSVIDWNNDDFSHYIEHPKEAIQLLHHAYVYDFEYVLLLIGNKRPQVVSGIFVRFDDDIKDSYGNVLENLLEENQGETWKWENRNLKWFLVLILHCLISHL